MRRILEHAIQSTPFNATTQSSGNSPKAHIRYLGFDGIPDGRRLHFRVKLAGLPAREVTCDVSNSDFTGSLSIQHAAPMAFERLTELLAQEDPFESTTLLLTGTDMAAYLSRHRPEKGERPPDKARQPPMAA
jgi:hypothetical protein